MKRIVIFLLPMLLVISLVFFLTNRDFDSHTFLDFVSTLRFSNALEQLNRVKDIWGNTINDFNNVTKPNNLFDIINNLKFIGDGIFNIFVTGFNVGLTIFDIIADIITNVTKVFNWLFIG